MKLSIESTEEFVTVIGVPMRLWRGTTSGGRPVDVYVALIGTDDEAAQLEIRMELGGDDGPVEVFVVRPASAGEEDPPR